MRSVDGFTFYISVFDDAYETLWREKLIAKLVERERRPTQNELWALSRYFYRCGKRSKILILQLMWFANYSARRLSEITRLECADNDDSKATGLVRDVKHLDLKTWSPVLPVR
jgi:hypothetical protein